MGADYVKLFMFQTIAGDCGLADALTFTMPAANTCLGGAYRAITGPDRLCPKQCDKDAGEEDEHRRCEPGEDERSPASCGSAECGDAIAALDDETMAEALEGMASCAEHPNEHFR